MSTLSISLSDGAATILLYPKWDSKFLNRVVNRSQHRMLDGSLISYLWLYDDQICFELEYVPVSEAAQINAWWAAKTSLETAAIFDGMPLVYWATSFITDDASPFSKYSQPQHDHMDGSFTISKVLAT